MKRTSGYRIKKFFIASVIIFRRSICLFSFILTIGLLFTSLTNATDPDLHGWWRFDEKSGTTAFDFSGYDNNGTLQNNPTWVTGKIGGALQFDGIDDFVEVPHDVSLTANNEVTVMAWINSARLSGAQGILAKSDDLRSYSFYTWLNVLHFSTGSQGTRVGTTSNISMPLNEWVHVCAMVAEGQHRYYTNGQLAGTGGSGAVLPGTADTSNVLIGKTQEEFREFQGMIDDVRIFMRALTQEEVQAFMLGKGYPYAYHPNPADGTLHPDTWATLSWGPGENAVSHDVYFGDTFDGVNEATHESEFFRGNQTSTFYVVGFPGFAYPDGLDLGTTYYWRIDEVNDTEPNNPLKGDVWSFSIPPKTAYNPIPADGAEFVGPDNVMLTWSPGHGAKMHEVYLGTSFIDVEAGTTDTYQGSTGVARFIAGTLESKKVYYWRVEEFDAFAKYKGDVWTFTTPGAVGNPQPAYGALDIPMNTTLTWAPGESVASHQIYFGKGRDAVCNAGIGSPEYKGSIAIGAESYNPGLLDANTTYYWRVDEVDDQGIAFTGPLWIFATGAFLHVDNFESYSDDDAAGLAIWQTWIDGVGIADNGSQVGYLMPSYVEQTIVHGGAQSMPLLYVNEAGVTNSEATKTLMAPRDWTQGNVTQLSLWFVGNAANAAEPLYVAIVNSSGAPAIAAYDEPRAVQINNWTQWIVPLQVFADQEINLGNVDKIAIGLGSKSGMASAGGSGTVFVDDIRLYKRDINP